MMSVLGTQGLTVGAMSERDLAVFGWISIGVLHPFGSVAGKFVKVGPSHTSAELAIIPDGSTQAEAPQVQPRQP
jgi:hypothetical protein